MTKGLGDHVRYNPNNPDTWGECQRSHEWFNTKDLVKQYEWAGTRKIWTGLIVGKPYLDEPNEQLRAPKAYNDPTPVPNPRIPNGYRGTPFPLTQQQIMQQFRTTRMQGTLPVFPNF
jgi:hypothetical protein